MKSKSQQRREESLKSASVGGNGIAGIVKPVKSNRQSTLQATKNHFKPDGEFVKEGTKIKVGSSELQSFLNSGCWEIIN